MLTRKVQELVSIKSLSKRTKCKSLRVHHCRQAAWASPAASPTTSPPSEAGNRAVCPAVKLRREGPSCAAQHARSCISKAGQLKIRSPNSCDRKAANKQLSLTIKGQIDPGGQLVPSASGLGAAGCHLLAVVGMGKSRMHKKC